MVAVAAAAAYQLGYTFGAAEPIAGSVSIRITYIGAEENTVLKDENVEIFEKTSVFEVLKQIADVKYRGLPGFGVFVTSIDNRAATETKWWLYQVNRVYPNVAADRYIVTDGDNIVWKYTSEWPIF
jgi:hypothetical protein